MFFWTPQGVSCPTPFPHQVSLICAVIGGSGFIISSLILIIEVQHKWYLPNITEIGWHGTSYHYPSQRLADNCPVGFWNLVGALGFTLSGAFGYSPVSGEVYESGLSTFWGSWAFLIGGGFQLWETIWREPQAHKSSPA